MASSKVYDSLIIGAGAAGLSAALGLGRVQRSCAVFSHPKHRNNGIDHVHTILGLDHIHPNEIYARGKEQIKRYNTADFIDAEITKIDTDSSSDDKHPIYTAVSSDGRSWTGRTVIIATGVKDLIPTDLEGYAENWPQNIYQCPFCDGYDRKDLPKGVLCWSICDPMFLKFADMSHHMAPTDPSKDEDSLVTIFTNGPPPKDNEAVTAGLELAAAYRWKIETRPIVKLSQASDKNEGIYVHVQNPDSSTSKIYMGFVFHKPLTAPTTPHLLSQLNIPITTTPMGTHATTIAPFNSTSTPGVFVAGDIGTPMTTATVAMSTGVLAAGGVAHYCNSLDDVLALKRYRGMKAKEAEETVSQIRESDEARKIDDTGCITDVKGVEAVKVSA